jgi:hypothetical protein
MINSRLSVCGLLGLRIICARLHAGLFLHTHRHVWTRLVTSFCAHFGEEEVVLGGSTQDMVKQYLFSVPYGQYRSWNGEVCSNSHGGGERGYYRCAWSFSSIIVLQSIPLHLQYSPDHPTFGYPTFCFISGTVLERSILSTVNSACSGMNHTPPPCTFYILCTQLL